MTNAKSGTFLHTLLHIHIFWNKFVCNISSLRETLLDSKANGKKQRSQKIPVKSANFRLTRFKKSLTQVLHSFRIF